jgi:diguanylate cyclase (GGDEF)-like protein/PAS domain S-box-containing protein
LGVDGTQKETNPMALPASPNRPSDPTAALVAAQILARKQSVACAAFDSMRDPVISCDAHGRINLINRAMHEFAGLDPTGLLPESWADYGNLYEPDGRPLSQLNAPLGRALRGEVVHDLELLVESRSGRRRSMVADGQQVRDPDGALVGAIVVWHDVTEQRQAQTTLAFNTLHDSLTGLPNRALFVDRVTGALDRARRRGWSMAVLAVNFDRFADTANRLGADSRGNLISEVARRLEDALRSRDGASQPQGTLAHLGGDQFLLLCEQIEGPAEVELLATRLQAALRAPMTIAGGTVTITAAIGSTFTGGRHHDPEALILEAETAMHRAKRRGAGCQEPFLREM